jgi:hypothetical protein
MEERSMNRTARTRLGFAGFAVAVSLLVVAGAPALAGSGGGDMIRSHDQLMLCDRDQLSSCEPTLAQDRLHDADRDQDQLRDRDRDRLHDGDMDRDMDRDGDRERDRDCTPAVALDDEAAVPTVPAQGNIQVRTRERTRTEAVTQTREQTWAQVQQRERTSEGTEGGS